MWGDFCSGGAVVSQPLALIWGVEERALKCPCGLQNLQSRKPRCG